MAPPEDENTDKDSKTEQPTTKRLEEAATHGQFAISREITQCAMLGSIAVAMIYFFPMLMQDMYQHLVGLIEHPDSIMLDDRGLQKVGADILLGIAPPLLLIAVVCMAVPIISQGLQTGFRITPEKLIPDITKIWSSQGWHRIFSLNNLVEFGKNLGKLFIIGTITASVFWPTIRRLETFTGLEPAEQMRQMYGISLHMLKTIMIVAFMIAVIDYRYQMFRHISGLKMSKQEIKDEHKQSEGDPKIKNRLRRLRIERARSRMMAKVPEADVVITNPTHFAIALKYDSQKMAAPTVIAKGQDFIALKIREVATENKIVIVENPPLARALYASVEIDQEIPAEHYKAVAEVITYVYKLRGKIKRPAKPQPATKPPTPEQRPS